MTERLNWTELIMMIGLFILRSVYGKEKSLQIPLPWKVLREGEAEKMFSLVWRVFKRIPWGKKQNPKPNNNKHQKPLNFFFFNLNFSLWMDTNSTGLLLNLKLKQELQYNWQIFNRISIISVNYTVQGKFPQILLSAFLRVRESGGQ